jgi:uncharacterized protein involved in exopolysaccharide biosynthesis
VIASDATSLGNREESTFGALLYLLWRYKVLVILVTLVCTAAAVAYALVATPIFHAETVITDARESSEGGLASIAGQLGGLGSLAGVSLGGSGGASREARAVLQSRHLIQEFITRNDLLPELLRDSKGPPVLWSAVKRFQGDILNIHEDVRKGTVTVGIDWTDPVIAARWANGFVALANDLIRARAIEDSKRNVAYLNDQTSHTDSVEIRAVMYDLIKSETKTLMLANGRIEYAFRSVDPAVPPALRSRPQRTVIVLFGAVCGFLLGGIFAYAYDGASRRRREPSVAAATAR